MILYDKISTKVDSWRERIRNLLRDHGSFKVADVTVDQILGGIRGVPIQISDISYVDAQEGIRLRGYTIPELLRLLPKPEGAQYPYTGGLFYLLMANELPTLEDALEVEEEWKKRSEVPEHVYSLLKQMPPEMHPMTMFSQAILMMQTESVFAQQYLTGELRKEDYWIGYLEDSMNLTAKLPVVAAYIYNLKYNGGVRIDPDPALDLSANFAHMIGKGDDLEYRDLCRLFFMLHSDHEGGNVSAHASHLVASALSDVYYSVSAGMNGLAGPLHGLANQECLRWLLTIREEFPEFPSRAELERFVWSELNSGRVIPGYGHAVLRTTDPRFLAQLEFGRKRMMDDELFQLVNLVYEVVPGVLSQISKVSNPWPNVDAISGALQYHYGVREYDFFTVMFGVSRALGLTTHATWARVLMKPIERPKSLTTRRLEDTIEQAGEPVAG